MQSINNDVGEMMVYIYMYFNIVHWNIDQETEITS